MRRTGTAAVLSTVALTALFCWAADGARAEELSLRLMDPASREEVVVGQGGRVLHVAFFATWCPPCVEELGLLAELHARWEGRGYRLIVIGVNKRQSADRLNRFGESRSVPGRLLYDATGNVERQLAASDLPTHIVFDSAGKEVLRAARCDRELEAAIERMMTSGRRRGADR